MYRKYMKEVIFTRNEEVVLHANANLPNGSTLEQMNTLIKRMETYLSEFKEIKNSSRRLWKVHAGHLFIFISRKSTKRAVSRIR